MARRGEMDKEHKRQTLLPKWQVPPSSSHLRPMVGEVHIAWLANWLVTAWPGCLGSLLFR
jgi:hypothetical protein